MRDILAHQYDRVDIDTLWDVVENDIPELIELMGNQQGRSQLEKIGDRSSVLGSDRGFSQEAIAKWSEGR